jgi:hypothetical protein
MKTITDITKELRGQMCWGVEWDSQLNLSMNFGGPHLSIREPFVSRSASPRIREIASLRAVTVEGTWLLWIFCAYWKLTISDSVTATSTSSCRMKKIAMSRLDGQKLMDIRVNPITGATDFTFDLGARLQTKRFEKDDSEIWMFHKPNGFILSVRGDGTYTYCRGKTPPGKKKPRQIQI